MGMKEKPVLRGRMGVLCTWKQDISEPEFNRKQANTCSWIRRAMFRGAGNSKHFHFHLQVVVRDQSIKWLLILLLLVVMESQPLLIVPWLPCSADMEGCLLGVLRASSSTFRLHTQNISCSLVVGPLQKPLLPEATGYQHSILLQVQLFQPGENNAC